MIRNYFLINLLLVTLLVFFGVEFYRVVSHKVDIPSLDDVKPVTEELFNDEERAGKLNAKAFDVVTMKDLFRPSRNSSIAGTAKTESPAPKDAPKLFGTIILNNIKTAIMEDPETKTTKSYSINDTVGGYTVSEIQENKVVLLYNDEKVEVKLRDDKGIKPAPRRRVSPAATRRPTTRAVRRAPRRPAVNRGSGAEPGHQVDGQDMEKLLEEMEKIK